MANPRRPLINIHDVRQRHEALTTNYVDLERNAHELLVLQWKILP